MSIRINGENGVVCRVPNSMFGYFGWPSIARMDNGTLAVAVSGRRAMVKAALAVAPA